MNKKRYLIIAGIVVAVVLISILFYKMFANHPPVITSLEAERETVLLSRSCQIECNATDPDGDELSYAWSAGGGGITGEGAVVNWTAPDSVGSYNVTAMVTDGRGATATKQVTITVRSNKPPIINSVTADTDWVTPSGKVSVTCNATDPDGDELSYAWLPYGGDISSTGAVVTWTAPEELGDYVIIVMVTDGYGGSAMNGTIIEVSSTGSSRTLAAANSELEQVKTASLGYFGDHGYWPTTSDDLSPIYISGTLKAVYIFDTGYGWVLNAIPTVGGWTGITFQRGTAGLYGTSGHWVES